MFYILKLAGVQNIGDTSIGLAGANININWGTLYVWFGRGGGEQNAVKITV